MRNLHIRLWHAPYNGGWIWFDRAQWKRFACGWKVGPKNSWKGGPDPVLWWCFGGFCGRILLQSWPWQPYPGQKPNYVLIFAVCFAAGYIIGYLFF